MSLKIQVQESRPMHFVISLEGRLDTQTHQQLQATLEMVFETPVRGIQLDLHALDYISSMGLRAIMMAAKKSKAQGTAFVLLRPQPPVRAVLDIANALPRQAIFASIEEADRYFDAIQKAELDKP